jgi:hypothetical protein
VDADGLEVAADPAGLDVGDLAGAELDRVGRRGGRDERLIETDGRVDLGCEEGVSENVLLREGLLDEKEVEVVESCEMLAVGAGVGRVGVDLQRQARADQITYCGDRLDVGAGFDLQLDPHVAVVDVALHLGEEFVDRGEDPHADAARDALRGDPEEVGERAGLGAQLGIEDGHLERPLGHRVSVDLGQRRADVGRLEGAVGPEAGEEVVGDDVLGAFHVLGGVARFRQGDALAPSLRPRAVGAGQLDPHEQDVPPVLLAEAGAERRDQGHLDASELDATDRPAHVRRRSTRLIGRAPGRTRRRG